MEKESAADSWLASLTNKIADVPDTVVSHCFQGRAMDFFELDVQN